MTILEERTKKKAYRGNKELQGNALCRKDENSLLPRRKGKNTTASVVQWDRFKRMLEGVGRGSRVGGEVIFNQM